MLKIRVLVDKKENKKMLKFSGLAENYPEINKDFTFQIMHDGVKVFIELGKVYNIKNYGDLLLLQTELGVAEVWILEEKTAPLAKVLPFTKDRAALLVKGGKLTAAKHKSRPYNHLKSQDNIIQLKKLGNVPKV